MKPFVLAMMLALPLPAMAETREERVAAAAELPDAVRALVSQASG